MAQRVRVYVRMCPRVYRIYSDIMNRVVAANGKPVRPHVVIEEILGRIREPEPGSLPEQVQKCKSIEMVETNMRIRKDLLDKIGRSRNYAVIYAILYAYENALIDDIVAAVTRRSSGARRP